MWNKLFKSKSKSSKNLSTSSSSHSNGGGPSSSPPLDLVPIYNIDNRIRYGDDDFEPAADDVELRRNHNRDSIGPQMCGIPMRKSKFSSAFKSLSLRRGSTKNQLKLYPGEATPVDESPTSVEDIQISAKRASLRPSKSDNNLNEKQNYADQEKEDPVYEQQQQQYRPPDPFLEIPDPPEHLELQPCPICARNFVPTSLVKHIAICERMQSKKRKPFDSSRQRREGTELASYLPKNFGLPQNHPQARVSPPKTTNPVRKLSTSKTPTPERKDYSGAGSNNNSMSTSQTLATMSSSGGGGGGSNTHQTTATGATTPRPILKRSLSQQNEPCPYCERCFGFKAYDRHVEWCREKALLNKNIQHHQSSVAKERLQARIQYKAPQLKSKRALNREKYSGSLSCGGSTSSLADLDLPFPRHRSHLNSMSSSLSSDNKSDHSGSLKKIPSNDPGAVGYAGDRRGGTLPGKKREIRANLLENENFRNDSNNNNSNPTGKIFGNNLLIRSTQDVRREKEQAVSVERVERLELVATGRAGEQRVPLKRGATKIVKCNKSDASFFDPHKQTKNAPPPPLAERSSLSCTAASGIQNNPSQETLASKSSFETFEQYFYYYEKQNRQKDRDLGHEEYEGFEDEELEIPFTNTMKRTKGKSGQCGKRRGRHGVAQGGLEEDDDFVPPFYDSNELRPIVDRGGGGGPGGEGGSASRRKGSRIPKKVTLHQMHQDSQDPSSGGGKNHAMLPRLFCTERVESFDLSRDRNEIIHGYTPDRYDPFLSAKRQLEELFSPTSSFNTSTKQQQQTSNSRVTSPVTPSPTQVMSKSVVVPATTKTTSPNMNLSNFRRASSLRMPRKVSRPMFIEKAKSNIQKGITDDGPVSPNFLKSSEYDEIPIKSVFNAAQMAEKPKMRDSSSVRRNLKLDIKDPNMPATDVPLSKTDSLAVFLKYEHELNLLMSEKEMKDKSNSLSKRSASLTGHERKETYSPSVNSKSNERSSPSEKEKSEKPVQEIQPIKKVPQKLVPIKLDPINITYNNNNSNSTSKPTVISLDAILGKSSTKPKAPPPEEKLMTRKESTNYIDPKLINRCDNLPIMVNKLTKPDLIETKPTVVATTIPKVSPEPPKRLNGTSPETEGGGGKAADNRLSDLSTKSDDSKPTLTRQNGTSASRSSESSSIGDSSREPSPPSQRSEHKPNQDAKSQSPDSGVERSTPTKQPASTPIGVQKPERPPLPSFDDFDFEEFISSFEDERRSFQNAFYSRNATSNNNNNSSTSSFNQRVTNNSFTDNSVKSAVNGSSTSNNNTSSPSHFAASKLNSSQSYYKPLNINGRSEEEETRQKSPQVPPRRHQPLPPPPEQPPSTIRNLPSIQPVVAKNLPGSPTPNNPNSIFSYGPPSNDTNNNNNSVKSSPSSTSRLGSGNNNSFNNSPLTATTHQPYQQQHQQHTTLPKTPSATNHMFSATPSPPPPPLANSAASNAFLDDLSPTERDLMKSVQELDRMCESSSSMYPADSDEVSSVEGYPLSGSRDGGQRGHRPSEGSKFSADSAYGSLSRQSPNQQDSNHTHTVRRTHHHHHHRGGATSQQQQLLLQQDAFDNSSGSESSLPPITTATLKAQKIELHSHGSSTKLAAGPTATAAAAAMAASQMSKFCHECGSRFMISTAKFCMECGVRRIMLD
ncbi:uncharacterized protein LOC120425311 isoform X2 [Culex pipiens pallens]|uniref:uncharacterized protein LOC120425311 isoform X2 n=1 Tax=Culex pipiens pallens TaxID=42434 RepID=UPI001953E5BB|nr:uncharacterized protein LOC120425311 isoform X2 [Culex pipiens pallens]